MNLRRILFSLSINDVLKMFDNEKTKAEIKKKYNKLKPELLSIKADFNENVGKDYKDGSSIKQGWAYHIVDIPYFRNIPYHKNTCIEEYKFIKSSLPIKPNSFLDIGCSCGFHTFNLIRDFNIKYCKVFEVDPAINDFLNSIKKSYELDELEIDLRFDDTVELKRKYDVTIFLNVHMWIYKQIGKNRTFDVMRNVINNTKWLFFQTACNNIREYKTAKDVKNMIQYCGGKSVKHINSGKRDLFLVKCNSGG